MSNFFTTHCTDLPNPEYFTVAGEDPVAGERVRPGEVVRYDHATATLVLARAGCTDPVGVAVMYAVRGQPAKVLKGTRDMVFLATGNQPWSPFAEEADKPIIVG